MRKEMWMAMAMLIGGCAASSANDTNAASPATQPRRADPRVTEALRHPSNAPAAKPEVSLDARCTKLRAHLASLPVSATDATVPPLHATDEDTAKFCAVLNEGRYACLLAAPHLEAATDCRRPVSEAQCDELAAHVFQLTRTVPADAFDRGKRPTRDEVSAEILPRCNEEATQADLRCLLQTTSYEAMVRCDQA
jgi:hypothetical protein